MYNKSHALREMYEFYHDRERAVVESATEELREKESETQEFLAQVDKYRKQRELKDSELGKFKEAVYDNHMQTALEAIYISALEKVAPLTEESEEIAKSLVENYIKEAGGAREIIRTRYGKTYLLDTIFEAVDSAAQKDIELFFEADEEDKKEKDNEEADGSEDVDVEDIKLGDADNDGVDDSQDSDFGTGADNDKNKEASDSKEKSDQKEDKEDEKEEESKEEDSESEEKSEDKEEDSKEDKEDSEDKEDKSEDKKEESEDKEEDSKEDKEESEDKEEESEDEDEGEVGVEDLDKEEVEDDEEEAEEEPAEDPDLDEPDTAETVAASQEEPVVDPEEKPELEEPSTSKEELFDKLENNEDVSDAVDIIAKRISDAEAKFIEKNAEDKKKIENIVNKVQDRIDAVTQDENSTPEDIEKEKQESQVEAARLTNDIRNDRFHTVYEIMVRDNMDYIYKNKALTESYKVDGRIDMTRVMDNSRTMYGWLETVNTIQLDKVDERYIQSLINGEI